MAASIIVVIAGLKAASGILLPVLVAAFLAVISIPPINFLARHRMPRWAATVLVFLLVLGGLAGVSVFLGASIKDFAANLDLYQESLQDRTASLFGWVERQAWLERLDLDISSDAIVEKLDASKLMALFADALGAVTSMLSNTMFVLITSAFILGEAAGFRQKLRAAFGTNDSGISEYAGVLGDLQIYLAVKTQVSLVTGVLAAIACAAVGIDYWVLWGLVAFLLNYVPTLGSIIAAAPAVLLALVQYGWERALIIVVCFLAINIVMGNAVEPRLMGKRLGLSALVVFLSLVFWGYVWGPVGMVLCVPLTMLVKILLQNSDELRWIAVMMGSGAELRQLSSSRQEEPPPAS